MIATVILSIVTLMMFFFVYLLLFGGSDFHERDCIGATFNRLLSFAGKLRNKPGQFQLIGASVNASVSFCRILLKRWLP